jgi:hypothetical protein
MTPDATTPAGRRTTKKAPGPSDAGHRRSLRQTPAASAPRRVSGPLGGRPRAATAATTAGAVTAGTATAGAAIPIPGIRHRRRSRVRTTSRTRAFALRSLEFIRGLPDHRLLDRAVRGRAWILMLGVMLAGIVAMQVEVLKLGASMGRAIEQGTALQSRNDLLRAYVASLADDQRIKRLAAGMGMVMPAPSGVGFLTGRPGDPRKAAANIQAPNDTSFLTALAASEAPTSTTASTSVTPGLPSETVTTQTPTYTSPVATASPPTGTATSTGG